MILNLGCADDIDPNCVNVDICKRPGVDEVVDLNINPWPWKDNVFDGIKAFDVIEHLHDKIVTMNECWRVLRPGGRLHIFVPTTNGMAAFADPTHVSYWNQYSFLYFTDGTAEHKRFARAYGIIARFIVVNMQTGVLVEEPKSGERLEVILEAVK